MCIGMGKDLFANLDLKGEHILPGLPGIESYGIARRAYRRGRSRRDALGDLDGFLLQVSARDHPGHKTKFPRGLRVEVFAKQEYVERPATPHIAWQPGQTHAPTGHHADIGIACTKSG